MSSPQLTRANNNDDVNNVTDAEATDVAFTPDGGAAAERRHRHRPLAPARSVRYTREPYLVSDNSAGGATSVELGSDMTEITNVGTTGGTDADRASR